MAELTAYIDESGTHDSSPLTIMSAFVGYTEAWERFESEWGTILRENRLDYIHAIELKHGDGQFKDKTRWPGNKRLALAAHVENIPHGYSKYSISFILNNAEYDQYYIDVDKKIRKHRHPVDSKYGICCRVLMSIIARMVEKFEEPDSRIQLVFESGHKNGRAAEVILEEMYQIAPDLAKYINPTVSYALKKMSPGVQAADMLAYPVFLIEREIRATFSTYENGMPNDFPSEQCPAFRVPIRPKTLQEIKSGQFTIATLKRRGLFRD